MPTPAELTSERAQFALWLILFANNSVLHANVTLDGQGIALVWDGTVDQPATMEALSAMLADPGNDPAGTMTTFFETLKNYIQDKNNTFTTNDANGNSVDIPYTSALLGARYLFSSLDAIGGPGVVAPYPPGQICGNVSEITDII